nr:transglutaminase-like domain-containing protein [uncultured Blautia sp.]
MEILVFDTSHVQDERKKGTGKKNFLFSFLALFLAVFVLIGGIVSAFSIPVTFWMLMIGMAVFSLFFTWFYMDQRLNGKRFLAGLGLVVLLGGFCFFLQDPLIRGFYSTANSVIRKINQAYSGNLNTFDASGSGTDLFFLVLIFILAGILGVFMVKEQKWLPVLAVFFPVFALTGAAGGRPGSVWLYLLLMILLLIFTAARSHLSGWKCGVAAVVIALAVSVPAWCVARPLSGTQIPQMSKAGTRIQSRLLQSLWQILPKISGGNLNLSIEGVGGGVENGVLGAVDGYYFTGVDALKVTSSQKPKETVYLKGFVGETYTGSSFEPGDGEVFQDTAVAWNTEGDSAVYIQNLPFLRMMYYEKTADQPVTAAQITVENLNANTQYTYVPYNAFLNDNYQIYGGDGYVGGQTAQDDIFSFYWRDAYKEAMESYRDGENTDGVLNETEASYRAYCDTRDLQVPEQGLEHLKKECAQKKEEEHWGQSDMGDVRPDWDIADEYEEIRQYVVKRLVSQCSYELDVDKLPEGQDFVEIFLYDTKEGYSMHFAAAATMMFRLFGVPARYVVGYAAPKEIFSADGNGNYTAVLEDSNAHAWVEIYQPFLGWTPVEVTPGMEAEVAEEADTDVQDQAAVPEEDTKAEDNKDQGKGIGILDWISGHFDQILTAAAVILVLAAGWLLFAKQRKRRKCRLGIGLPPAGRVQALYRSVYQLLIHAGMPKEYTETEGQVTKYLLDAGVLTDLEEAEKMKLLVLEANYGFRELSKEDTAFMEELYRRTRKAARKKDFQKMAKYEIARKK